MRHAHHLPTRVLFHFMYLEATRTTTWSCTHFKTCKYSIHFLRVRSHTRTYTLYDSFDSRGFALVHDSRTISGGWQMHSHWTRTRYLNIHLNRINKTKTSLKFYDKSQRYGLYVGWNSIYAFFVFRPVSGFSLTYVCNAIVYEITLKWRPQLISITTFVQFVSFAYSSSSRPMYIRNNYSIYNYVSHLK